MHGSVRRGTTRTSLYAFILWTLNRVGRLGRERRPRRETVKHPHLHNTQHRSPRSTTLSLWRKNAIIMSEDGQKLLHHRRTPHSDTASDLDVGFEHVPPPLLGSTSAVEIVSFVRISTNNVMTGCRERTRLEVGVYFVNIKNCIQKSSIPFIC